MTTSILIRFTAAAALALSTSFAAPVLAETTVSNPTAADLQTQCLLSDDHHTSGTNSRFTRCCSLTLGYCIECTMSADEPCEKISIREGLSRKFKPTALAPATFVAPKTISRGLSTPVGLFGRRIKR